MPSDPRVARAREHHRKAASALTMADRHRAQRDELIRQVRATDPDTWTYAALALAVGCSPELVAAIVKGRVPVRGVDKP